MVLVLTGNEFDNRNLPESSKAPGVRLVSDKPPQPQDIIRSRKVDKNGKLIIRLESQRKLDVWLHSLSFYL